MNKKVIIGIVAIIVIAIVGIVVYKVATKNEGGKPSAGVIKKENNSSDGTNSNGRKVLVVYFSAQNHTKVVAEKIAGNLNADIFVLEPFDEYTSADLDWTDKSSRVNKEHDDESLRNIKLKNTKVENWDSYDVVLIGYPIWWGIAAWPTNTFVKDNDFSGKTVIPFCTSASSGLGESGKLLEKVAGTGNWVTGHRFNENPSDSDIKSWTDSLIEK